MYVKVHCADGEEKEEAIGLVDRKNTKEEKERKKERDGHQINNGSEPASQLANSQVSFFFSF